MVGLYSSDDLKRSDKLFYPFYTCYYGLFNYFYNPDNAIHQVFQIVEEESRLPTLDSTRISAKAALNFALK